MTSQPDKFFRDKLENLQQPAPIGAWDRIESNLAKPVHKLVWVRVAAGVTLLAAATFVLWPSEKTVTEITKTQHEKNIPIKVYPAPQNSVAKDEVKKKAREQLTVPSHTANPLPLAKTEKQSDLKTISTTKDSVVVNPTPITYGLIAEATPEGKELPSKTIIYTTEEVNTKFLKKKLPPQATPADQDASGIQKLIGLAYDAKNSEAPLGNLRQKKDDILALNFGKKKGEN